VTGDDVSAASVSATFNNKNVATGKSVSVSGISISGADAANYNLLNTTASTTAEIYAKGIVGNFTAASKVFDMTANAVVVSRSLAVPIAGDDVSLSGGTATFSDPSVGNNKVVTLTGATLAGVDAGNYNLTSVNTTTANITAWSAAGKGFYSPVGADAAHSVFTPAPGSAPTAKPSAMEWNSAKGGSTIPLKFNVYAGTVEKTTADAFPGSNLATAFTAKSLGSCSDLTSDDPVDFTTTGNTNLRYDTTAMQWIQNWQTPKVNGDTCYRAYVTFADGSTIESFFKLKK
jgi:hypothetical protein